MFVAPKSEEKLYCATNYHSGLRDPEFM